MNAILKIYLIFIPRSRMETNRINLLFFSDIVKQISDGVAEFVQSRSRPDDLYNLENTLILKCLCGRFIL
jgi:hypothetical protein